VDLREESDGRRAGHRMCFDPKSAQAVLQALDDRGNRIEEE